MVSSTSSGSCFRFSSRILSSLSYSSSYWSWCTMNGCLCLGECSYTLFGLGFFLRAVLASQLTSLLKMSQWLKSRFYGLALGDPSQTITLPCSQFLYQQQNTLTIIFLSFTVQITNFPIFPLFSRVTMRQQCRIRLQSLTCNLHHHPFPKTQI